MSLKESSSHGSGDYFDLKTFASRNYLNNCYPPPNTTKFHIYIYTTYTY